MRLQVSSVSVPNRHLHVWSETQGYGLMENGPQVEKGWGSERENKLWANVLTKESDPGGGEEKEPSL